MIVIRYRIRADCSALILFITSRSCLVREACPTKQRQARLFMFTVAVTLHKLVNTTGSINQFRIARIEWVRRTGDFQLNQWIGGTVDFNSVFRCGGRTAEGKIRPQLV